MQNRLLSCFALAAFAPIVGYSQAVLFSDNFSTDTRSNYSVSGTLGSNVTYSATGGVGGGGGLLIGQGANDSTSIIPTSTFTFGAGAGNAITISMMLKFNSSFGGGTSKAFIGIADGANYSWGDNPPAGTSTIGGVMQNAVQIGVRSGANGGGAGNSNTQPSVTLTPNHWYLFSVTLTKPASGTSWTASSFLQNYGADGLTAGSVASSFSNVTANLTNDTTLSQVATSTYLNFGVRNQSWSAVDNFLVTTPIPEPSSFAALAGLTSVGFAMMRRRRR